MLASKRWRSLLFRLRPQLFLLFVIGALYVGKETRLLPSPDIIAELVKEWFERYGLPLVVSVSFLESLAGFNIYFPGSIAILAAMALTAGDPIRAALTLTSIFIPSLVAHQINFTIGRAAGRRVLGHKKVLRTHLVIGGYMVAAWHPHFAAVAAYAAGTSGIPYLRFVSLFSPALLAWNIFWGVAMYSAGLFLEPGRALTPYFLVLILAWIAWELGRDFFQTEERNVCGNPPRRRNRPGVGDSSPSSRTPVTWDEIGGSLPPAIHGSDGASRSFRSPRAEGGARKLANK